MAFIPLNPSEVETVYVPVATSQTIVLGDLVYLNGSSYATICGSDPTLIYGVAAETAPSVTADGVYKMAVWRIKPGVLFTGTCSTTTAVTQQGVQYGVVTTSGATTVDVSDTTNDRVLVHRLDPRDTTGTSGGRLIVSFITTNIQGFVAA
jgi:hypothetical protein